MDSQEKLSEAHSVYHQYHQHSQNGKDFSMFQKVSKTGVIYATSRANAHGFSHTDEGNQFACDEITLPFLTITFNIIN